ncbi:MAG TPA: flagellar motor switch protein FliG [Pirellulaceae bacterium]|jgi:flagellar motor switch protein FliG|nr:flagellar motor switch protein FliG [Pirellulaceae bacterium]
MAGGPTSLRKAAIVLASMPAEDAGRIMKRLSAGEVRAVSLEIARLGSLRTEEQQAALADFFASDPHRLGGPLGGLDLAKNLIELALGEGAKSTLQQIEHSIEATPFNFLKQVDPRNLLTYVSEEHPQTLALILSYLAPQYAAEILAGLAPEKQLSVIRRIARMEQTAPETVSDVERALQHRIAAVLDQSLKQAGGVSSAAEILNVIDRAAGRIILDSLAHEDEELVEQIRRLMFVFDDIVKLGDKDIQTLLKHIEASQWALALKGCRPELKQKVLGNMSKRASEMLAEEMDMLGPVRSSEVELAQQAIVDMVRTCEDNGEISTRSESNGDALIE